MTPVAIMQKLMTANQVVAKFRLVGVGNATPVTLQPIPEKLATQSTAAPGASPASKVNRSAFTVGVQLPVFGVKMW